MCQYQNDVPKFYWNGLNDEGERHDLNDRAELCCGVYDIKVGQDYMPRPPMPPTYYYVVDVSKFAVENGSLEIFASTLSEAIQNDKIPGEDRTKFGLILYDSQVHLIGFMPNKKLPMAFTLNDLELPMNSDNFLVNLSDMKDKIVAFLKNLTK